MTAVELAVLRARSVASRATDPDELAALLEASGVSDEAAAGWYGYPSVFALAELVYLVGMAGRRPDGSFDHPRSALNLRLALAIFGFVAGAALAVGLFWVGLRMAALVAAAVAVIALVNAGVVQYRRVRRRDEEPGTHHTLFE